ncbi:MAG: AAA family ATPase [Promethearchaeota archaeon]
MKICNIELKNFRSFKDLKLDIRKINIIIGQNNTGKSNILYAIYLFSVNN